MYTQEGREAIDDDVCGTAIFATKVKKQITITSERPTEKFALFSSCASRALLLQEAKFSFEKQTMFPSVLIAFYHHRSRFFFPCGAIMQIEGTLEFSWQLSGNLVNECSANLYHTGGTLNGRFLDDASVQLGKFECTTLFISILNTPLYDPKTCSVGRQNAMRV